MSKLKKVSDTFTDSERLSENIDEHTSQLDSTKSSLTNNQPNPNKNIGEIMTDENMWLYVKYSG